MKRYIKRARRVLLTLCLASMLAGCGLAFGFGDYDRSPPSEVVPEGGGMTGDEPRPLHVGLVVQPLIMRRASTGTLAVSIMRNGVVGPIDLTVTDLPEGVSAAPAVIAAGANSGAITFTSTEAAQLVTTEVTVLASLSGEEQDKEPVALTLVESRLDTTFGDGGFVIGNPYEVLQDVDMDSAGHLFVAVVAPPAGLTRDRLLVYQVGSADAVVSTALTVVQSNSSGYHMAVAPSGDFIVVDGMGGRITLYPAEGGAGSSVGMLPELASGVVNRVRAESDDEVVVMMYGGDFSAHAVLVLRYLVSRGDFDPAFGDAGTVTFGGREDDLGGDVLVIDGGLLTCIQRNGSALDPADSVLSLTRLTDAGTIDLSFNDGAATFVRDGGDFTCRALAADGQGFVAAGEYNDNILDSTGFLARVSGSGAADLSFGDAGLVTHPALDASSTYAVAVDADGGILSAGTIGPRMTGTSNLLDDLGDGGAPNLLFGIGDGGTFPIAIGASGQATSVHVLADGHVLVAGSTEINGAASWYVARLLP